MSVAFRLEPIHYRRRDLRRQAEAMIMSVLDRETAEVKRLLETCVATWEHQVKFVAKQLKTSYGLVTMVTTDDPIFGYVDKGTRPHLILPKHAPRLVFQAGYKPKTVVKVLGSQAGGKFGDTVFAMAVHHPGTKARGFTESIQSWWQPRYPRQVQEAINRALSQ